MYRGYRNGSTSRRLTLGSGAVELEVARVRNIPPRQEPFESQIVSKCQRPSDTIDEPFMKLFIEGLAARGFERALRLPISQQACLSPSTISRLVQKFKGQYTAFERQDLSDRRRRRRSFRCGKQQIVNKPLGGCSSGRPETGRDAPPQ